MDESNRRIVLLGKPGVGKSSLANTIFGEKRFTTYGTLDSETYKCKAETKSVRGRSITVVDTPGLFDTDRPEEKLKAEIVSCITKCSPGPHAFIIVLQLGRFTEQEQAVINKIQEYFSEEVFKYTAVLFTHGDQLREGQTIMDFFQQNKLLSDLIRKCGGRCHVIDNKYWKDEQQNEYRSNKFQVKELLKTIDEITEANAGGYYTNEIREQAGGRVNEMFQIMQAGSIKGALCAAVFGLAWSGGALAPSAALCAAAGAVIGGLIGYVQAEGADTQPTAEIVKKAPSNSDEACYDLD